MGVRLDKDACNFSNADFESGKGMIHVEGELTLDYVRVRCIADVDLTILEGTGYLTRAKALEAAGD